jgi:hypothetical protein
MRKRSKKYGLISKLQNFNISELSFSEIKYCTMNLLKEIGYTVIFIFSLVSYLFEVCLIIFLGVIYSITINSPDHNFRFLTLDLLFLIVVPVTSLYRILFLIIIWKKTLNTELQSIRYIYLLFLIYTALVSFSTIGNFSFSDNIFLFLTGYAIAIFFLMMVIFSIVLKFDE